MLPAPGFHHLHLNSVDPDSAIDFYVLDGDHHQVANTNMSVPNVKNTTIKQPYSGNFLELEVVDVTRGN